MHQVMKVAGMGEDLQIIWSYLETKVAPFIAELFSGVHDSNSAVGVVDSREQLSNEWSHFGF